jgi:excisionase family DNA binding protein
MAVMAAEPGELLTTKRVAELLGVSQSTVERWIKLDQLPAIRLPSGHYRVRRGALEKYLRQGKE